ncbi:hypothetical protein BG015_000010 [Linnemannia schmuckeri]|uniref:Uncharacterized protein n=1 Tax=Linnemannia schmuckeri TaxID=64567 RepID=A0A9P5SBB1_9FUNG|nr:hypothetical protein BG015_000010 [Linnemannia schmuckeri]
MMKTTKAFTLFTLALLTTLATTTFRFASVDALAVPLPFYNDPIFGDYPVSFREIVKNKIDVGACGKAALSGKNQSIPVTPIDTPPHWHAISVRLDAFDAPRSDVCNQCVILRSVETDKMIIAVLAGDCSECEDNQINLTPAAYKAINEGVALNETAAVAAASEGFFKVVPCPRTAEEVGQYAKDLGVPPKTIEETLKHNPICTHYPITFRENVEHLVDIGACTHEALSENLIPFKPLFSELHWHVVNVRMDVFDVGRAALCNFQCVVLRGPETGKNITAVLAGDCSKCEENQINLTPAAFTAINEEVMMNAGVAPNGF